PLTANAKKKFFSLFGYPYGKLWTTLAPDRCQVLLPIGRNQARNRRRSCRYRETGRQAGRFLGSGLRGYGHRPQPRGRVGPNADLGSESYGAGHLNGAYRDAATQTDSGLALDEVGVFASDRDTERGPRLADIGND